MNAVYTLFHEYEKAPGADETTLIGIYTTREKAEAALARVRDKPGFRDYPDGFDISEAVLDRDEWTEGFVRMIGDKVVES
ncbi:MAG: hypothetical protein JO273_00135 [Methylobacteriaceae bacterium]|nr:hypothetical protein [Methylobacteriaceae bacterium]